MIRIKNWQKFQSYKDRKPPWIRFHREILDDFKFQMMSADARALLPMLWLLASEDEDPKSGLIRIRNEIVTFRLRIGYETYIRALRECYEAGFIEADFEDDAEEPTKRNESCLKQLEAVDKSQCDESVTKPLQNRNQTVTPETETETETETDNLLPVVLPLSASSKKRKPSDLIPKRSSSAVDKPDDVSETVWSDWTTLRKAKKAPITPTVISGFRVEAEKAGITLEKAIEFSVTQGWQGFKANWYVQQTQGGNHARPTYEDRKQAALDRARKAIYAEIDAAEPEQSGSDYRFGEPELRHIQHVWKDPGGAG